MMLAINPKYPNYSPFVCFSSICPNVHQAFKRHKMGWLSIKVNMHTLQLLLLKTSPLTLLDRFFNNFTRMVLGWSSTKIAQTVLLYWTRWPLELKIKGKKLRHHGILLLSSTSPHPTPSPTTTPRPIILWILSVPNTITFFPRPVSQFLNLQPVIWKKFIFNKF